MGGFGVREILFCLEMNNNEHFLELQVSCNLSFSSFWETVFNISAWHF